MKGLFQRDVMTLGSVCRYGVKERLTLLNTDITMKDVIGSLLLKSTISKHLHVSSNS